MKPYDPKVIEPKWQTIWSQTGLYKTPVNPGKHKYYSLEMFPYPSGDLHTGHWYAYTGEDVVARFKRMSGKKILHPMGFDAFGLPAENAAIKNKIPPAKWTFGNIERMRAQLTTMGASYDWDKQIITSDPEYYRWTQWLFLLLYKNHLAYRAKAKVNWCPKDKTVLANEQVVGEANVCERCGTPVIQKELEQWFFKITDYAEELLKDLDALDWSENVKTLQRNWIGKSAGAEINFDVFGAQHKIEAFTTRPDTLFGATYMVLAPEHPLVDKISTSSQKSKVKSYKAKSARQTELDRLGQDQAKTGIFSGAYAINPLTKTKIPIWIADYVLMSYGRGAIMAVPAHDERDWEFAKHFNLPIKKVITGGNKLPFAGEGKLVGSGKYNGLDSSQAREAIVADLRKQKVGRAQTNYRLRDWTVSRQRYWGTPIPIIYCQQCGTVPVPQKDLPVELPLNVKFEPTGQSPLLSNPQFINAKCPECSGAARRETDTMDTFVDSSWYFLRYPSPDFKSGPFDPAQLTTWLPVDQYMGGIEHAILHLLYARFITKALADHAGLGFREPFLKLFNQGLILGPDGQKMSKSRGNVVNPDEWVERYGADTLRCYLLFLGPYDQGGPFDPRGINGLKRWLDRVWNLVREWQREAKRSNGAIDNRAALETELTRRLHQAIKKVSIDLDELAFNTALSGLMELTNDFYKAKTKLTFGSNPSFWQNQIETLLKLLAPFAPHITEELWSVLGHHTSLHLESWPVWDEKLLQPDLVPIIVQINGKFRSTVTASAKSTRPVLIKLAKSDTKIKWLLEGKQVTKTVVVPGKLVNFVLNSQ